MFFDACARGLGKQLRHLLGMWSVSWSPFKSSNLVRSWVVDRLLAVAERLLQNLKLVNVELPVPERA